jgi:hypothetical protein
MIAQRELYEQLSPMLNPSSITAILCLAATVTSAAVQTLPDTKGPVLEVRVPEPGLVLEPKDTDRTNLWYTPVATEPIPGGARVWYQRVNTGEANYSDQRVLCVGEIRDGAWTRLNLDMTPPPWGGPNNICLRRSPHKPTWGGFNVFQMIHADGVYRMLYWDQPAEKDKAGAMLAVSPDGLHWSKQPGAVFTEYNDAFTLIRKNGRYLLYQTALEAWPEKPHPDNLDKRRRIITVRRSNDLKAWTPQELLLKPDRRDKPETEFYLLKVFPSGRGYAGLLKNYFADPKLPGQHSGITFTELIVSRDGLKWSRPFRGTKLSFWSYADPVLLHNKLHFVAWDNGTMRTVAWEAAYFDQLIASALAAE